MSDLVAELRQGFQSEEYRYSYVESFLDTYIAAQIRTLREQQPFTQGELAEKLNTKQGAISRLENVNYSGWNVSTLKKLAKAFGVRLKISFEEFATLPEEIQNFNRGQLARKRFENDRVFGNTPRYSLGVVGAVYHATPEQPRIETKSLIENLTSVGQKITPSPMHVVEEKTWKYLRSS